MTGFELYALYEAKNLDVANCGVEPWGNLDELDQEIWNAMAAELRVT